LSKSQFYYHQLSLAFSPRKANLALFSALEGQPYFSADKKSIHFREQVAQMGSFTTQL
jgi:hypothetical protein